MSVPEHLREMTKVPRADILPYQSQALHEKRLKDALLNANIQNCAHCGHDEQLIPVDRDALSEALSNCNLKLAGALTVEYVSAIRESRSVVSTALEKEMGDARVRDIYRAYWTAIKELYPECWIAPKQYDLFKPLGLNVFHSIFLRVLELAYSQEKDLADSQSYKGLLEPAIAASKVIDSDGVDVADSLWWRADRRATKARDSITVRILAARISNKLPNVDRLR